MRSTYPISNGRVVVRLARRCHVEPERVTRAAADRYLAADERRPLSTLAQCGRIVARGARRPDSLVLRRELRLEVQRRLDAAGRQA